MKRSGFTLLEIILVLALTMVLLGLLGLAVDVHLRVTDASRNAVEQSQLARLLLQRLAGDLRNAIPVTRAPSSIGGLRGNRQELQLDISRLPALNAEQAPTSGNPAPIGPPGDVRTVTYAVAKPGDLDPADATGARQPRAGLVRREYERATFAWAVGQGRADELRRAMKVLSPEVDAIEFTYFDGGTTYEEWDSVQQGKLPTAVKIAIAMRPPRRKANRRSTAESEPIVYDVLVDLPNARATLDQTLGALAKQSATTSPATQSSDSSSQSSSSQSAGSGSSSSGAAGASGG